MKIDEQLKAIHEAKKETCRHYRKTTVCGRRMPLTILRVVWYEAFLAGVIEGEKVRRKAIEEVLTHNKEPRQ